MIAERLLGAGTLVGPPPHPCARSKATDEDGYYSDVGFSGLTAHAWTRLVPDRIVDAFLTLGSCLVVGDAPGDPDCFCSATAWARGRRAVGLPAEAHVAGPPPKSIRHLFKEAELVDSAKVSGSRYDTVVLVDNDGQRIGAAAKAAMQRARRVVVVDHHEVDPTRESLGLAPDTELLVWKISGADAAALMTLATVLRGLDQAQATLTPAGWREVLEPVIAGVYSDTRGFTAGRTSSGTMGLLRSVLASRALDISWVLGPLAGAVPRQHLLQLWDALELRTEEHHGQQLALFKLDGRTVLSTLEKARQIEPELTWSDL